METDPILIVFIVMGSDELLSQLPFVSDRLTKPETFADCVGDELPYGWEVSWDPQVGTYYINHLTRKYCLCFELILRNAQSFSGFSF